MPTDIQNFTVFHIQLPLFRSSVTSKKQIPTKLIDNYTKPNSFQYNLLPYFCDDFSHMKPIKTSL